MKHKYLSFFGALLIPVLVSAKDPDTLKMSNTFFDISFLKNGISGLLKHQDSFKTDYVAHGRLFTDVVLRYKNNKGRLDSLNGAGGESIFRQNGVIVGKWSGKGKAPSLQLDQNYALKGQSLFWTFTIKNSQTTAVSIQDLAIPISYNNQGGENSRQIFEEHVIKHHFISGNNSYLFWERPTGRGPYLLMLPLPGTHLEYFDVDRYEGFKVYIRASHISALKPQGNWRQPITSQDIAPGASVKYGFKFRWASDYNDIRKILFEEGLIDVQVLPGMTVPTDLDVKLLLHTNKPIKAIEAEYPNGTIIKQYAQSPGKHFFNMRFSHLGENKLTITYGENYHTYLEFFVTEPLETLYKKRASFLVNHQQHTDSAKWYNGLFSVWDMKNHVLRGPDNPDTFTERMAYVLASDDPALGKAPFLAAKNVFYPNQKEIDAIEYYIKNFVWGKLQRTGTELPHPYGVYGTPNWHVDRDPELRKKISTTNLDKEHIWRSYDYPHIIMLYYNMYKLATDHPGMTHYLNAKQYLERARETAKAYFTYPYEILPWYETYKWGCYNEIVLIDLMAALRKEGFENDANWLQAEWEKKVKYFLYDDPYPFRSEYAVDATAYESTHAIARYAVANTMQPDSNLWYDKNLKRWYSHQHIEPGDGRNFMDREIAANIASRGWLEPAYYYLGSDYRGKSDSFTLTYMAPMGGWGILDYGLNFSPHPDDYIRLGYASYLSSFALMNTGTAKNNYGYWYPGKENDGASGWAFEPQQYTTNWIQKKQGRGPWYYDGEVDIGYGGATRMAATIITADSTFGLVAYGGNLKQDGNQLKVIPADGINARFYYRAFGKKMDIELLSDGFSDTDPISVEKNGNSVEFVVKSRSADIHQTTVNLKGFKGRYQLSINGKALQVIQSPANTLVSFIIPALPVPSKVSLLKVK